MDKEIWCVLSNEVAAIFEGCVDDRAERFHSDTMLLPIPYSKLLELGTKFHKDGVQFSDLPGGLGEYVQQVWDEELIK